MTLGLTLLLFVGPGCGDGNSGTFDDSIRNEQVTTGEWTFDLRVAGPANGEAVFLLHGFPQTSYEWRSQLMALASSGYHAIAPDQRGYSPGARPSAVGDYNIANMVVDVLQMADALGIGRFHLVGHDWGAGVAWGLASVAPDRIRSLAILSIPHPDAFAEELADTTSCQYRASGYFDFFVSEPAAEFFLRNDAAALRNLLDGISEDAVDEYARVLSQPGAMQAALNWYRANVGARDRLLPPIGAITVPTLFVWSDEDFAICREPAEKTGDFVDAPYEFVVLEGVDHWIPERAPHEVSQLLRRHFEGR